MVLSKAEHPDDPHTATKIECYVNSIKKLYKSLSPEMHEFRNESERHDISVMRNKIKILLKHAIRDLQSSETFRDVIKPMESFSDFKLLDTPVTIKMLMGGSKKKY